MPQTPTSSRATEALLDALHGLAANGLIDEMKRAIARAEAAPDDPEAAVPPQLLGQVIRFLASNGINAPATSKRVVNLATTLKEFDIDLDGEVLTARHPN